MRFKSISFSVARAIPLYPLSRDKADEYANVKPFASCTVEFDENDSVEITETNVKNAQKIVAKALEVAQDTSLEAIRDFSKELRALYKPKPTPNG